MSPIRSSLSLTIRKDTRSLWLKWVKLCMQTTEIKHGRYRYARPCPWRSEMIHAHFSVTWLNWLKLWMQRTEIKHGRYRHDRPCPWRSERIHAQFSVMWLNCVKSWMQRTEIKHRRYRYGRPCPWWSGWIGLHAHCGWIESSYRLQKRAIKHMEIEAMEIISRWLTGWTLFVCLTPTVSPLAVSCTLTLLLSLSLYVSLFLPPPLPLSLSLSISPSLHLSLSHTRIRAHTRASARIGAHYARRAHNRPNKWHSPVCMIWGLPVRGMSDGKLRPRFQSDSEASFSWLLRQTLPCIRPECVKLLVIRHARATLLYSSPVARSCRRRFRCRIVRGRP